MIELETDNGTAICLYNLLTERQRKQVVVNETPLNELKIEGLTFYSTDSREGWHLFLKSSMLRNVPKGEQWFVRDKFNKEIGYIQNVPRIQSQYYVYFKEALLHISDSWEKTVKFVLSLREDIRRNVRIDNENDHFKWEPGPERGIPWELLRSKNKEQYLFEYDDGIKEYSSIPLNFNLSARMWNEVRVFDIKDGMKEIAKFRREIKEYINI